MSIQNIGQLAINVKDLPRAKAFYQDILGLKHLFDAGPFMSFFDCGGVRLLLETARDPQFDHASSIVYFRVADIDASCRTMAAKGLVFEQAPALIAPMPDHDLWMAFFRESENNLMALMSEVRRP
jgi:methylmalonyl-CoA/ethylmalonyl-CoA epimerase